MPQVGWGPYHRPRLRLEALLPKCEPRPPRHDVVELVRPALHAGGPGLADLEAVEPDEQAVATEEARLGALVGSKGDEAGEPADVAVHDTIPRSVETTPALRTPLGVSGPLAAHPPPETALPFGPDS